MHNSAITIKRYHAELKSEWDRLVSRSKNGSFLFLRNYMDYHNDRFHDSSLLFLSGEKLIAILPANTKNSVLFSHGGLTFGGIISDYKMNTVMMLEIFRQLILFLKSEGIKKMIYKPVPHIYHTIPAEEDLYALFINGATIVSRTVSSTIFNSEKIAYSKGRKWSVKSGTGKNSEVKLSVDFKTFFEIVSGNLKKKYNIAPTHTAEEMELLANRFPENIKLYSVYRNGVMIAGSLLYENPHVAHTQYLASTDEGKENFALDFLLDFLIKHYVNKRFFNFGISTDHSGKELNEGLLRYKEEFGARTTLCDTYELIIS